MKALLLREGDVEGAKRQLLEAGKTPGGPQFSIYAPKFELAAELLARGGTRRGA